MQWALHSKHIRPLWHVANVDLSMMYGLEFAVYYIEYVMYSLNPQHLHSLCSPSLCICVVRGNILVIGIFLYSLLLPQTFDSMEVSTITIYWLDLRLDPVTLSSNARLLLGLSYSFIKSLRWGQVLSQAMIKKKRLCSDSFQLWFCGVDTWCGQIMVELCVGCFCLWVRHYKTRWALGHHADCDIRPGLSDSHQWSANHSGLCQPSALTPNCLAERDRGGERERERGEGCKARDGEGKERDSGRPRWCLW